MTDNIETFVAELSPLDIEQCIKNHGYASDSSSDVSASESSENSFDEVYELLRPPPLDIKNCDRVYIHDIPTYNIKNNKVSSKTLKYSDILKNNLPTFQFNFQNNNDEKVPLKNSNDAKVPQKINNIIKVFDIGVTQKKNTTLNYVAPQLIKPAINIPVQDFKQKLQIFSYSDVLKNNKHNSKNNAHSNNPPEINTSIKKNIKKQKNKIKGSITNLFPTMGNTKYIPKNNLVTRKKDISKLNELLQYEVDEDQLEYSYNINGKTKAHSVNPSEINFKNTRNKKNITEQKNKIKGSITNSFPTMGNTKCSLKNDLVTGKKNISKLNKLLQYEVDGDPLEYSYNISDSNLEKLHSKSNSFAETSSEFSFYSIDSSETEFEDCFENPVLQLELPKCKPLNPPNVVSEEANIAEIVLEDIFESIIVEPHCKSSSNNFEENFNFKTDNLIKLFPKDSFKSVTNGNILGLKEKMEGKKEIKTTAPIIPKSKPINVKLKKKNKNNEEEQLPKPKQVIFKINKKKQNVELKMLPQTELVNYKLDEKKQNIKEEKLQKLKTDQFKLKENKLNVEIAKLPKSKSVNEEKKQIIENGKLEDKREDIKEENAVNFELPESIDEKKELTLDKLARLFLNEHYYIRFTGKDQITISFINYSLTKLNIIVDYTHINTQPSKLKKFHNLIQKDDIFDINDVLTGVENINSFISKIDKIMNHFHLDLDIIYRMITIITNITSQLLFIHSWMHSSNFRVVINNIHKNSYQILKVTRPYIIVNLSLTYFNITENNKKNKEEREFLDYKGKIFKFRS